MDENMDQGNLSNLYCDFIAQSSSSFGERSLVAGDLGYTYTIGCQKRQPDSDVFEVQTNRLTDMTTKQKDPPLSIQGTEICQIRLDSLVKLKDSTRQLMGLLDEIQDKVGARRLKPSPSNSYQITGSLRTSPNRISTDEDDCSVYKRLTRKCHCLNNQEYNDFIIHFNECTKYFTSTLGEIIKNMRILKKFLYMGGDYTKHALLFLNEGLTNTTHQEKVDITQGCAHADVCNVFDEKSIVILLISYPCSCPNYGDAASQGLAASFLYKLAQLEEGRRYLKFSSKITSDIKKVIRTKACTLEEETKNSLSATLNIMHPPLTFNTNVSYYCKPVDEGFGSKTTTALLQYRQYMTLEEVFTHLDLLHNLSTNDIGKYELNNLLPALMVLFKKLLEEYDNSEMNIIVTNILNNILSEGVTIKVDLPKTVVMADTSTEPIQMKSVMNQMPPKRPVIVRNVNKSKLVIDRKPNKFRLPSKTKGFGWESPPLISTLNKYKKSNKKTKDANSSLIVVPLEDRRCSR